MNPIYLPPGVIEGPGYGTDEWINARLGRVTASRFGDIMTEPRSKTAQAAGLMSESANSYLLEVVASAITGQSRVGGKSAAMERGVDLEADAIDAYATSRFIDVEKGRLIMRTADNVAATPDGFIDEGEDGPGLIEVKCPESKQHLQTFLDQRLPDDYLEQVQGQMWVAGRRWCDFISYDDRFPAPMRLVVIRVVRNDEFVAELSAKVIAFGAKVAEKVASLKEYLRSCSTDEAQVVDQALNDHLDSLTSQA